MVRTHASDVPEQKVLDDVSEFGWHCVHVLGEAELVEYSFTVGLFHSFGHPELVIFGLPAKIAHQVLSIAANAAKAGEPLDLSAPSDALFENCTCFFAEIPANERYEHLGFGLWFYQGNSFPAYQVIWPSRSGLFPWHPSATVEFKRSQPIIALVADGH